VPLAARRPLTLAWCGRRKGVASPIQQEARFPCSGEQPGLGWQFGTGEEGEQRLNPHTTDARMTQMKERREISIGHIGQGRR